MVVLSVNQLVLWGSLSSLADQLEMVLRINRAREQEGYSAEELEFLYVFVTMNDPDVCPSCASLAGMEISGAFIKQHFPYAVQFSSTEWFAQVHPHCRCVLRMINEHAVCAVLLYGELLMVT